MVKANELKPSTSIRNGFKVNLIVNNLSELDIS